VPLIPFFIVALSLVNAAIVATVLSGVMLFGIGLYEARVIAGSVWRSGIRIMVIGLASGLAGLVIGHFASYL
jgi:VIT1/CCC1 family predicted Fe2+/Mn2+ transporter